MIAPLSGAYSTIGTGNVAGAKQAIKDINSSGGIDGRKIILDVRNDETNPAKSRTIMKDVVSNDKYVAVIGSGFGSAALAAEPLANKAKIPYLSMSATGKQVDPIQKYVWIIPPTSSVVAEAMAKRFKDLGVSKVAVLHDNGGFGTEGVSDAKAAAKKSGIEVVEDVPFSLDSTNFTSQLTQLKSSDADLIWVWTVSPQAITITKQFKKLGLSQRLALTHGNPTPQYLSPSCPESNGVIIASTVGQVANSEVSASEVEAGNPSKKLAEKANKLLGKQANQFGYDGYTAGLFLEKAMKTQDPTREGIVKALSKATYTGPEGVYKYTADNHAGLGPDSVKVEEIKDCKLVVMPN